MTGRAIATLGLTIALSALLCAQQVPPPPPPNPPPEGAPITPALSRLLASHDEDAANDDNPDEAKNSGTPAD